MHIGVLTKRFPNLSETFVLNQITGLIDLGHDVSIFARSPDSSGMQHDQVKGYMLVEKTHYFGDAENLNNVSIVRRLWRLIRLLLGSDAATRRYLIGVLLGRHRRSIGRRILDAFYAHSFLSSELDDVEMLLCHFGPMGNFAIELRNAGIFNGKIATVFHGYDISQYVRKHGNAVYKDLLEHGDLFLPISENWQRKIIALGAPERRTVVHKMGIDSTMFKFKERRLVAGQYIDLLSVARLVEKKGIEFGIRAVALACESHKNIRYRIAGDGPLRPRLETLIEELGLEDHVSLLGWQTQEQVANLMDAAHVLIAPSVTSEEGDQEGIPVALMEAMAQGIPVISTRHSGIPELVHDREFGILTEERDIEDLAAAISEIIELSSRWPEMGRMGADFVNTYHNISILNQELSVKLERAG